jgi:ABC-type antimicrobial peptide transport system permease subunit
LVLLESIRDLAFGAIAGLAAGAALCALLAQAMANIGSLNALTTGLAIGSMAVVGLAAASLPALRVRRLDPAQLLRS